MCGRAGFATRVHGFPIKTKALAREIPPATQAKVLLSHYQVEVLAVFICIRSISPGEILYGSHVARQEQKILFPMGKFSFQCKIFSLFQVTPLLANGSR